MTTKDFPCKEYVAFTFSICRGVGWEGEGRGWLGAYSPAVWILAASDAASDL